MPRFEPFRALRYSLTDPSLVGPLTSPPYDVFDEAERNDYARHADNIVHVDYPIESDGDGRYDLANSTLTKWIADGILVLDNSETYSVYRMSFTDDAGRARTTIGVIGGLEVVDEGAGGVLPHERTTPKAKTDRLDLTRATSTNLSPVWGLSLTAGLTDILRSPGEVVATMSDEQGVVHTLERISEPSRVAAIKAAVESHSVLIADGHHRYAISRTYRDETRAAGGTSDADLTMTYVQELVEEQLSIAAIHRLFTKTDSHEVLARLAPFYRQSDAGAVGASTIAEMDDRGCLCLVHADGTGTYLTPIEDKFSGVRNLDSARLEHALGDLINDVTYQHGVSEVTSKISDGIAKCAVLIRPVSIEEIRRTANTGELMPPKSTFFTPKLRTGLVMRPMGELVGH